MNDEVLRLVQRLLERQANKIRNLFARGEVALTTDGPKMQTQQIRLLDGEVLDNAERAQNYGFTSAPHPGSECFVAFVSGGREHGVILAVDDRRYRLTGLKNGEVALYTDEGDTLVFKRERTVELHTRHFVVNAEDDVTIATRRYSVAASESVTCTTPDFRLGGEGGCAASITADMALKGDLTQQGGITSSGDHVAAGVSVARHTHPGDSGGVTGQPQGGV